MYGKFVILLSR